MIEIITSQEAREKAFSGSKNAIDLSVFDEINKAAGFCHIKLTLTRKLEYPTVIALQQRGFLVEFVDMGSLNFTNIFW